MKRYDPMMVGKRIRRQRIIMGLTQEEVAEKIERSYKYYQDIERGTCGMSIDTILSIAECLHTSIDYLISGNNEKNFPTFNGEEEQQALIDALSKCSIHKKKYALELIKLFLKACGEQ